MIILDTHAWIWHVSESPQLSRKAMTAIRRADALGVHPISCWEVMMLVERGKLRFRVDPARWVETALARPLIEVLPLTATAAVRAAQFGPTFSPDPADRFIAASALEFGVPLITKDERMHDLKGLKCIW